MKFLCILSENFSRHANRAYYKTFHVCVGFLFFFVFFFRKQKLTGNRREKKWSYNWRPGINCLRALRRRWVRFPNSIHIYLKTWTPCKLFLLLFVCVRRARHPPCGTSINIWPRHFPSSCVSSFASSWSPHRQLNSSQDPFTPNLVTSHTIIESRSEIHPFFSHCFPEGITAQENDWTWERWYPTLQVSSVKTRSGWGGPSLVSETIRSVWLLMTLPAWWTIILNRLANTAVHHRMSDINPTFLSR